MSEALLPLMRPAVDSTGARAQKSISAFRTISEVAEELDVAQHVLRFWESKFTQVRPLKRGGGRRYYRPEDVDLLRQIRSLLYDEGYTIKGAQKLLRARRGSARGGTGGAEPPTPPLPPTVASARPPAASARPPGTAETRLALTALRRELLELKELMAKVRAELG
ncbi:MAG: MerR family transcriptional regulator [Geminicoccaceae bacterium]